MTKFEEQIPAVSFKVLSGPRSNTAYRDELKRLASACSTWGFVYLVDLDREELYKTMFDQAKAFFALPQSTKDALTRNREGNSNRYRGFFPVDDGSNSFKEGFETGWQGYELTGSGYVFDELSVFPEESELPGFRTFMDTYFESHLTVGRVMLAAFEDYFGLTPGYFNERFGNTLSTLRLLHYPGLSRMKDQSNLERDDETGVLFTTPTHTDSGIITLLLQDNTGGLQVLNGEGQWSDARVIENSLVMNIGDLLTRWTGGEFKATRHRIKAPSNSRYSVPFFFEPEGKALIEPFKESSSFQPVSYEAYLNEKFQEFVEYRNLAV